MAGEHLTHTTCPFCARALRVRTAPGRRVLCSGCQRSFMPPPPPQAITPPPPLPREPVALPPKNQSPWPLVAAVAGFLVLLAGATAIALAFSETTPPPASVDGPGDADAVASATATTAPHPSDPLTTQPPPSSPAATDPLPPQRPAPRPDDVRPTPPPLPRPTAAPPADPRPALPRDQQAKVNQAIDRGTAWLRKKQLVNGTFANAHTTGLAALPALTLLECGAPANDPVVQKAARFVRAHAGKLESGKETYELSLALLFLDRLGDAQDRPLIRTLALRLVAGQQPDGGWSYHCPQLKEKEQGELLAVLRLSRPRPMQPVRGQPNLPPLGPPIKGGEPGAELGAATRPGQPEPGAPGRTVAGGLEAPAPGDKPAVAADRPATPHQVRKAVNQLPKKWRQVPAIKDALRDPKARPADPVAGRSDNSNTQFATLALWAALRHDLPVERSLELNARRFRHFQVKDGSWKYHTTKAPAADGTPAMTGAGLLGLAVGHGLGGGKGKLRIDDPAVTRGIDALARDVGKDLGADPVRPLAKAKGKAKAKAKGRGGPARSPINLYFLWTVERVGVLYNVRTLAGKDWYRWGVDQLLEAQDDNGSWHQGHYHGSTRELDTCLALLFLKRANLAADLSGRLEFVIRQAKP